MSKTRAITTRYALQISQALVKVHLFKRKIPFFLGWNLTFRCNLKCRYCGVHDADKGAELSTAEVVTRLDALWNLGTRWVTFSGGEPLLRNDIGNIVKHAKTRGYQVYISTNGWLIPDRAAALEWVDHVNLSLDGDRTIHDEIRGSGSYDRTIEAIGVCKEAQVPVSLQCVLSSNNLDSIEALLDTAEKHETLVKFQPAVKCLDSSAKPNPIAPQTAPYREAMQNIIELKKRGAPIHNSLASLRHLAHWPDPTPIWCIARSMSFTIEPDGSFLACHQAQIGNYLNGSLHEGTIKEHFVNMTPPKNCNQCWCAPLVELALLFSMRPEPVLNAFRSFT